MVHRGALLFGGLPAVFSIDCNSTRPSNSALLESYTSAAAAPSGKVFKAMRSVESLSDAIKRAAPSLVHMVMILAVLNF